MRNVEAHKNLGKIKRTIKPKCLNIFDNDKTFSVTEDAFEFVISLF